MAVAEGTAPSFVELVLSPDFRADPYPGWAALREREPVHRTDLGAWVLTRHADVSALLRDPRTSTDERNSELYVPGEARGPRNEQGDAQPILFLDPPDHTRLRGLVSKAFTVRRVEELAGRVQTLVDELLAAMSHTARAGDGTVDLVEQFAYPLPVTVICEMLGVPATDHATFADWSRLLAHAIDPPVLRTPEQETEIDATVDQFMEYFEQLIDRRRAEPGDDLLTALLAAEDAGDRLTHEELLAQTLFLLIAGHETTVNLIGNGVLALLRNPDELTRLRDEPSLDKAALEELLRYDSPVQFSMRITMDELEIGSTTFAPGSTVLCIIGAANRDPAAFAEPDRLDLGRTENRHLAFGGGAHFCLGAPLARLEGRIAITSLVRRFPELALAGEPAARDTFTLRGLSKLPVSLG